MMESGLPPASDGVLWWTAFGAIAQAIGALTTFLAVVVSLKIASDRRKLKAKVRVGLLLTFAGDGSPGIYHIGFTILNQSDQSIRISSLGWRTGWLPNGPKPLTYRWAVQSGIGDEGIKAPYDLDTNRSAVTLSPLHIMKSAGMTTSRTKLFVRKLPLLGWAPIYGVVDVIGRRPVIVKVQKDLADFLRTNDHGINTDETGLSNTASI